MSTLTEKELNTIKDLLASEELSIVSEDQG